MVGVGWRRVAIALLWTAAACGSETTGGAARETLTAGITTVLPIGGGNALTLPAQRHLVRLTPSGRARWLLAVQQDSAGQGGLSFFRSDDEGQSFRFLRAIQGDPGERDTADLLTVGNDVALVRSFEGPTLFGSSRHDVYFQWWRYAKDDWAPQAPVLVFDSTSNTSAYYRAELARDSLGRLWVQAFRLNADGSATARIAVSTDGGAHFAVQPDLATFPVQGGGRLLSLGTRLLFLWDGHDGVSPARLRTRNDSAPIGTWSATQVVFGEGIYHGAALSAVADGVGGMHLVYKDKVSVLRYRYFDGTSFRASQEIERQANWETQPAITLVGGDLWIVYNRVITTGLDDEVRLRRLSGGVLGAPSVLDASVSFKGYPTAIDVLPAGTPSLTSLWGVTPTADDGGQLERYTVAIGSGSSGPGAPDLGAPDLRGPDLGAPPSAPDLGAPPSAPDLGAPPSAPDLGAPPSAPDLGAPPSATFSDLFARTNAPDDGMGASWTVVAGAWFTRNRAESDRDDPNLVTENVVSCRDCTVSARVLTFETEGGVYLRAPSPGASGDRYELVLLADAHVQLRRVRGGAITVLADAPSGAVTLDDWVGLSLTARGSAPVTLTGSVDGVARVVATDGSAPLGAGYAGLFTEHAGVWFDRFQLAP